MEGLGGFGFGSMKAVTRKRSSTLRRPQSDLHMLRNYIQWPSNSIHSSDNLNRLPPIGKELSSDNEPDLKCCGEGVIALRAPARYGGPSNSGFRDVNTTKSSEDQSVQAVEVPNVVAENKLSKVKLKLGGVTRTINAKSDVKGGGLGSLTRVMQSSDVTRHRQQRTSQGNSWKDIGGSNFFCEAMENSVGKVSGENLAVFPRAVRKSKRVSKRRFLDSSFDDHDNDDKDHYLEGVGSKLFTKCIQVPGYDKEGSAKKLKLSCNSKTRKTAYSVDEDYGAPSRSTNEKRNRSACGREHDGRYYAEKEEQYTYSPESMRTKQKRVSVDPFIDSAVEPPTTRRRSLQSGKDVSSLSSIEFPNGLPPAPSRKQKEKLSEEEQQAKKAAASLRRKMQSEKAARESEARAIRKILGVDSDKKKAEKQRVHYEKVKGANSQLTSSCTVRLVMGPSGTVVRFPEGVDLPSIFFSKPCSYPPPREICAGPSCTNSYKYRDSRSNLPLCSLQCYRAVQGSVPPMTTC